RFAASDAVGLPKFEIVDAMGRAAPREGFELGPLLGGRSDDELAEPAVRDAVARTELVEQGFAADARRRFEAAGWVVETRVDDLAAAGGGLAPEAVFALEHEDLAPGTCEGTCHGETHHARTDDHDVELGGHPGRGRDQALRWIRWKPNGVSTTSLVPPTGSANAACSNSGTI